MAGITERRPSTGGKTDVEQILSAWDRLRKQYRTEARGVRLELTTKDLDGALGRYYAAYVDNEGKQVSPTIRVSLPELRKSVETYKRYPRVTGVPSHRGQRDKSIVTLANAVVRHELAHRREEEAEWKTSKPDIPLPPLEAGEDIQWPYRREPPHGSRWHRINAYLQGTGSERPLFNVGLPRELWMAGAGRRGG